MPEMTVAVGSRSGLHARPAALFVEAAGRQRVPVKIRTAAKPAVRADSLLAVMSLGAVCGTEVTLSAEGEQAEAALTELASLLARDLDAEESDEEAGRG